MTGDWSAAQAMVGEVIGRLEGPDAVSEADIRRKLEAIGFDCPLHHDAACAQAHGFRTIVSPVSMTRVWATPTYWEPGRPRIGDEAVATPVAARDIPGEGDTIIATQIRTEHFEPLHPGDRVSGVSVLRSVTPKTTRIGTGAFLVIETTYTNQRHDVVTVETATVFRFDRGGPDDA